MNEIMIIIKKSREKNKGNNIIEKINKIVKKIKISFELNNQLNFFLYIIFFYIFYLFYLRSLPYL